MTAYDDLIFNMQANPQFRELIVALKNAQPVIPAHDPLNENTEIWKQKSAQQAGFDLCLAVFKIHLEHNY